MENAKVHRADGNLVPMRSLEPGDNPLVPINTLIPNFPATPDNISEMTGNYPFQFFSFT
jgi:hypothetical protein